jgi:hypothetical protein
VHIMRKCRKIRWRQSGHKRSHNMAHTSCILNKQGCMHARTYTLSLNLSPVRISARAHTHTHTYIQICNTYGFPTATMFRRTRLNIRLDVNFLSHLLHFIILIYYLFFILMYITYFIYSYCIIFHYLAILFYYISFVINQQVTSIVGL